ncbi:DUF2059 domain-containing protein [Bradyrhizobium sp. BR13661]|jgi:hypothetical protein|uniref:DUF2059 domain-containing protein n=1 Tax=Bradyrhizobium sp. BR13661 TaxID=2940622 RepID=UPI00247368D2|nr:DUF2059 domain-containing protein [Bradyrhizobium sp. BR13661]MDH6256702.1 hypothetical protein [Bradyrhizobium sp. BR13661]
MYKVLTIIVCAILLTMGGARADDPSPAAMDVARRLVTALRVTDQFKAMLPGILFSLRPVLSQDRPEIEHDFDAAVTAILETGQSKYNNSMIERAAALYARNFSLDELHAIEAFYRSAPGQKYIEKSQELSEMSRKIGDEISREEADEIKAQMTQLLRDKGHKL